MQPKFGFGPGEAPDAGSSSAKLSAILAAARRTSVYGPAIARAGSFARLSPIGIHAYLENRDQFCNPGGIASKPRTGPEAPGTVCGSLEDLLRLAARVERKKAAPPVTARRLTIRTPLGQRLASDSARDSLWHAFELPLFEELTGSEGEVLGAECEAHSGFHLATESAIFEAWYGELVVTSLVAVRYPILRLRTGWVGAIDRCTCPCGERVTRFVPVLAVAAPVRRPPVEIRAPRRRAGETAAAAV
jgi:hypothetical protein